MTPPGPNGADKTLGEIVADVSEKASLLVREEIELAKAEVTRQGQDARARAPASARRRASSSSSPWSWRCSRSPS